MLKLKPLLFVTSVITFTLLISACENTHVSGSVSYGMGYGSGYGSGYGYPMYYGNSRHNHNTIVVVKPTKNNRSRPSKARSRPSRSKRR